jgi:DNA-binding LytR/AlgR family response regulator
MLVVSLYLEMLVSLLSFAIIANYKVDVMGIDSLSIFILGINLYLIVFVTSFIRIVIQFREKAQLVHSLQSEIEKKQKSSIAILANRKNHHILLDELLYIESLDDYIKVVTNTSELKAREKISKLHSRLPDQFIRIHRSFIVNKENVQTYTKTHVIIQETSLPIGRTYKKEVFEILDGSESTSERSGH